ncbi:GAF and ANTAR domain-containing protein [Mycobacterium sp.]|uniref:GAF and ANTAR domain-containing protein n=1 Tax=Mycobacterium sp. TaxID=1785 RepID=UPI003F97963F
MTEDDAWSDLPVESEFTRQQGDADGDGLRAGVSGVAGGCVKELLVAVAEFAAEAIPGVDGVAAVAGVRCPPDGAPPQIQSWTATAEFARQIGTVQYEIFHEGPCVSCIQMRRPVISGSLGSDQRWPRLGGRVARMGVHSALSLPLLVAEQVVGAIDCFAFDRDVFDEHAVRLGAQFAGLAAVSVHNAQLLVMACDRAERLTRALDSRPVIDQAIGIIRARTGVNTDDGFDRVRQISQSQNAKLHVVARQLVEEAVRRARARHS